MFWNRLVLAAAARGSTSTAWIDEVSAVVSRTEQACLTLRYKFSGEGDGKTLALDLSGFSLPLVDITAEHVRISQLGRSTHRPAYIYLTPFPRANWEDVALLLSFRWPFGSVNGPTLATIPDLVPRRSHPPGSETRLLPRISAARDCLAPGVDAVGVPVSPEAPISSDRPLFQASLFQSTEIYWPPDCLVGFSGALVRKHGRSVIDVAASRATAALQHLNTNLGEIPGMRFLSVAPSDFGTGYLPRTLPGTVILDLTGDHLALGMVDSAAIADWATSLADGWWSAGFRIVGPTASELSMALCAASGSRVLSQLCPNSDIFRDERDARPSRAWERFADGLASVRGVTRPRTSIAIAERIFQKFRSTGDGSFFSLLRKKYWGCEVHSRAIIRELAAIGVSL